MADLVTSFETSARPGGESLADAVDIINTHCGTAYNVNSLGKWRRGDKPIPRAVAAVMLKVSLAHAVEAEAGPLALGDEAWSRIADALTPPDRR